MWPGITPFNVADLEYRMWVALAIAFDDEVERLEERTAELQRLKAGKP